MKRLLAWLLLWPFLALAQIGPTPGNPNVTNAVGTLPADHGGTGVANNVAATLTRSGSHALTITTSGTTGVTLPTSGTLLTSASRSVVRATADQSVANNTTLASATSLALTIAASEEWVWNCNIDLGTNVGVSGVKWAVTVPVSATLNVMATSSPSAFAAGATAVLKTTTGGGALDFTTTLTSGYGETGFQISVWVLNSTNAGTVQLQIAQSTTSGTAIVIRKGSHCIGERIAP